jgi:nucleotide-binding universal stress UspA family protein
MIRAIAVGTDLRHRNQGRRFRDRSRAALRGAAGRDLVLPTDPPCAVSHEQEGASEDVQWAISPHEDVDAIMSAVTERAQAAGAVTTTLTSEGDPAEVLVTHAEDQAVDVLVVGNAGMQRRVLGSVPNTVTRRANCTVVVVKTTDR